MRTRAEPLGIEIVVGDPVDLDAASVFGAIFQYPGTHGHLMDFTKPIAKLQLMRGGVGVPSSPIPWR
jgi:glycine dehydrogenase